MSKNKKFIDEKFEVSLDNAIHFINTKNLIKAKLICRKLIDDEINAFDAHQLMGSILLYEELPLEALGYFDKALLINNKVSLVWSNRSVALMNLGKFQDALNSVNQALSLDHQFADALFNKANILSKMNRYDEALIFIDDYLTQKPNVGAGWAFKGNFHFKLKQFNENGQRIIENLQKAEAIRARRAQQSEAEVNKYNQEVAGPRVRAAQHKQQREQEARLKAEQKELESRYLKTSMDDWTKVNNILIVNFFN